MATGRSTADEGDALCVAPDDPRRYEIATEAEIGLWRPDMLGSGYEQMTLTVPDDDDGPCVTTLVRHLPDADSDMSEEAPTPRFVCLAIHGWNDYFYHKHVARALTAAGAAFYAMDFRRMGRSLRPGQTFGYISDLAYYFDDIEACIEAIKADGYGDLPLFILAHSTGGLVASLWADKNPNKLAGLILNGPWLEFDTSAFVRAFYCRLAKLISHFNPKRIIPRYDIGDYQRTLTAWREGEPLLATRTEAEIEAGLGHYPCPDDEIPPGSVDYTGERAPHPWGPSDTDDPFWTTGWHPDPRFRVYPSWGTRAAWVAAIFEGHGKVARGLHIEAPIIVLTAATSTTTRIWSEEFLRADCVLNLNQIWKRTGQLGPNTELVKLDDAIHDVLFSRREVRDKALNLIVDFIERNMP